MTATGNALCAKVYDLLIRAFGSQGWWPGETPFEVMVGAILTQNTSWANVERAIERLKNSGSFSPEGLLTMGDSDLQECVRPSGIYRVKARRLKAYLSYFCQQYGGSPERMQKVSTDRLRDELLSISGIGPETADCILLYALGKPRFVVDAYTRRIFGRLGWRAEDMTYPDLQARFERSLEIDVAVYNEYHALIVHLGKHTCRPFPRCIQCPLKRICPTGLRATP